MVGQRGRQYSSGGRQWDTRGGRGGRFGNFDNSNRKNDNSNQIQKNSGPGLAAVSNANKGPVLEKQNRGQQVQEKINIQHVKDEKKTTVKEEIQESDEPKKFTGRCRLFLGNLPNDFTDNELRELFRDYGELSEVYLNTQRGFGFIKMDTRHNAEAAKTCLDGKNVRGGRVLRVRFATHGAAIKVKYLPPTCSNELLEKAFSMFGEVERAIVIVDDRGRPVGDGIVEFARKPGAVAALKRISEGVFLLGAHPRPVAVEPLEQKDEEDGVPEKFQQKTPQYVQERQQEPKFADVNSFEFSFGQKWKELYMVEEQQKDELKKQMDDAVMKLEQDMESALTEHQLVCQRQELMRKQEELRLMEERFAMEQERKMRQRQGEMQHRRQDEMFTQQRPGMPGPSGPGARGDRAAPPMPPPPAPPAGISLDRPRRDGPINMDQAINQNQPNMGVNMMGGSPGMRHNRFEQGQNMPGFQQGPVVAGGPNQQGNMHPPQGSDNRTAPNRNQSGGPNARGPPPPPPPPMNENRDSQRDQHAMDRNRDQRPREDFFDNKRPRRF